MWLGPTLVATFAVQAISFSFEQNLVRDPWHLPAQLVFDQGRNFSLRLAPFAHVPASLPFWPGAVLDLPFGCVLCSSRECKECSSDGYRYDAFHCQLLLVVRTSSDKTVGPKPPDYEFVPSHLL